MIYLCQTRISLEGCESQSPWVPCRQDLAPLKYPPAFPAAGSSCHGGMWGCRGRWHGTESELPVEKKKPQCLDLHFVSAVAESDKTNPWLIIIQFRFFSLTSIQIMLEPATWLNIALSIRRALERDVHCWAVWGRKAGLHLCVCINFAANYKQVLNKIFL